MSGDQSGSGKSVADQLRGDFHEELDVLLARHNEAIARNPELAVAVLIEVADILRDKFNRDCDVEVLEDGSFIVDINGEEAYFGFERAEDGEVALNSTVLGAENLDRPVRNVGANGGVDS